MARIECGKTIRLPNIKKHSDSDFIDGMAATSISIPSDLQGPPGKLFPDRMEALS